MKSQTPVNKRDLKNELLNLGIIAVSVVLAMSFTCNYEKGNRGDAICNVPFMENMTAQDDFLDITYLISYHDFEKIKAYILSKGDRQTYCNKYNNNPHYSFPGFEAYLNPEIGQRNINCDPALSDFNEMVISDRRSDLPYFHLLMVRMGDLENERVARNVAGTMEGKIYLLRYHDNDLAGMAEKVKPYIREMLKSVE